jgi:hypothetical protein
LTANSVVVSSTSSVLGSNAAVCSVLSEESDFVAYVIEPPTLSESMMK